jgi:ABC-2 type transport system ATP-binding protein
VLGWELVVSALPSALLESLAKRVRKVTRIAGDRYAIEIAAESRPDQMLAEITAAGGSLVSLNPLRETLEDFFVRRVAQMGDGARGAGV